MGAGVSAGGGALKSKVFVSEGKDDYFIPLKSLASHLKVYQHCTTGEVLVLVDHLISDIGGIIEKPTDWFQVSVSKKESKYLETLKVITSLSEKEASFGSDRTTDLIQHSNSLHFINGPDTDRNSRRSGVKADASRKNKLPPITIFPKVAQTSRRSSDSSLHGKKLPALVAVSDPLTTGEEQLTERENSPELVDKESDGEFHGFMPPRGSSKSTLMPTLRKAKVSHGSNSSNGNNLNNNGRESTEATDELDSEIEAEAKINDGAYAENQTDSIVTLSKLIKENLVYNSETRTHCCQICGDVADDSYPIEQVINFFLASNDCIFCRITRNIFLL